MHINVYESKREIPPRPYDAGIENRLSGSSQMGNIVMADPTREYYGFGIWDLDGTVKKHGNISTALCNLLIPSSINSASHEAKYILGKLSDFLSSFTKGKYYPDAVTVASKMHESSYFNVIYTLGRSEPAYAFLRKNNLDGIFDMIISTEYKSALDLKAKLQILTGLDENSLKKTKMIALGDSLCDLDCVDFSDDVFKVALESHIGRQGKKLEENAHVFVDYAKRIKIHKKDPYRTIEESFGHDEELREKLLQVMKNLDC